MRLLASYKAFLLSMLLLSVSVLLYFIASSLKNNNYPPEEWWKYDITSNEYLTKKNPSLIVALEKEIFKNRSKLVDIVDEREKASVLAIISNFESRIKVLKNITLKYPLFPNQKEGDHIYFFTSPFNSWQNFSGSQGYVLVRNGSVIDYKITLLN